MLMGLVEVGVEAEKGLGWFSGPGWLSGFHREDERVP